MDIAWRREGEFDDEAAPANGEAKTYDRARANHKRDRAEAAAMDELGLRLHRRNTAGKG